MVSYGVASATDPVGIECGGVATGCESGGASAGSEPGEPSAGSESGGASAGSATVGTSAVGGVVAAVGVTPCWSDISRPKLGLIDTESVLHDGALLVPVLLNGSESTDMPKHSAVLRGGHLKKPHLFTELIDVNGVQFITLDKTSEGLCLYLTGIKAKAYPLKHVAFFDDIQKRMIRRCEAIMEESKAMIAAAREKAKTTPADVATTEMHKIVKKTKVKVTTPKGNGLGRDSHKKRVLNALPTTGVVDMSRGGLDWHPLCMIRTGTNNVSMQYTAENFTKLFEIVHQCLREHAALKEEDVTTPVRMLRRRKSNPQHPKGPPESRQYFSTSKGIWMTKTRKEVTTPPSVPPVPGRIKAHRNRRFLKSPTGNPPSARSGLRPGAKNRVSTPGSGREERVLSHDTAPQPGDDDGDDGNSSSHDIFGE